MREQPADIPMVEPALDNVVHEWWRLCNQHMRTTLVSQGNALLAPVFGLILCVPNYVRGELLLGEVTQAAAAFLAVQSACGWLVDNYPRLAECLSSATRVGGLLQTIDTAGGAGHIAAPPSVVETGPAQ
jgi:putative ATP-binding cassette transporter